MKFADKLRLLLKRNGLTVLAFAKTQNISHTAVSKWLKGNNPSPDKIPEIASFFGIDVNVLINDDLDLPTETKSNYSSKVETSKIEDDFKKLLSLRSEITETFNEFSAMFDKRLSNIEKILQSKKF